MAWIPATLSFSDFENLCPHSEARPIPTKHSWGGTGLLQNQAWLDLAWPGRKGIQLSSRDPRDLGIQSQQDPGSLPDG